MLVLSRRTNEKIVIPAINTAIQVVAVKPGVVRLGITAPPEINVYREELLNRPQDEETRTSAAVSPLRKLNHLLRNRLNAANIGLALLRRQAQAGLVQSMAGTIDKIERELQGLQDQVQEVAKPASSASASRTRKALLVEDDQNERELFAGFLRLAGLDVTTAGDGADALKYLRAEGTPDIMLLDMVLPRCDGPTTLREIRRNPAYAGMKVFAVSGYPPEGLGLNPASTGADRWFQKPLNPEALLRDLRSELNAFV